MTQATGRVDRISTKEGTGKNGKPWKLYSLQIDGAWWGHNFDKPPCNEGDTISYVQTKNKAGYDTADKVVVTVPAGSGGTASGDVNVLAPPVNLRDVSIQYQSSRKDAIYMLEVMFANGAVKLMGRDGKAAKPAETYDAMLALVDELAARNYITLQEVVANGGVDFDDMLPPPGE